MALKITLRPRERMVIDRAVVTNGNSRTEITVENNVVLLREKDILSEKDADTLCRRIYFAIQLMYLDGEREMTHQKSYWKLVELLVRTSPWLTGRIDRINGHILGRQYYRALKLSRTLIDYEQEVIDRVSESAQCL